MTGDRIFKKRYGGLRVKSDSLSAMPTDVRKRSALPSNFNDEFGAAPQLGIAQNRDAHLPEGKGLPHISRQSRRLLGKAACWRKQFRNSCWRIYSCKLGILVCSLR